MKRIFFVSAALLLAAGCATREPQPEPVFTPELYTKAGMLAEIMEFLHANYADADVATRERLLDGALNGMVSNLDPYSGYESPKDFTRNESQRTGTHAGIGINCVKEENLPPVVTAVAPNSPAANAGLRPGVRILQIDGRKTEKMNLEQCMELARGEAGSMIAMQLLFPDVPEPVTVEMRRETIRRSSVPSDAARMLADGIGYLRIESFNARTPLEFDEAFEKLVKDGMTRGLIVDLRNNPGGLVEAATRTVSRFLPESATVFTVRHRRPPKPETIRAGKGEKELELPLAILINPYTASAAELFAGALRDNQRAKLIGMKSFGKGTLLRVLPLSNGGALRFASGYYQTPNGEFIEAKGLKPDLEVVIPVEKAFQLSNQPPDPANDPQLQAALESFPAAPAPSPVQE